MSDFENSIGSHCKRLYSLSCFASNKDNKDIVLSRIFLGRLHLEATWMEETLDSVGARKSKKWFPFREAVSGIKLFSTVIYELLHTISGFNHYNLLKSENDFGLNSIEVLNKLYLTIIHICGNLVNNAKNCGLHKNPIELDVTVFTDIEKGLKLDEDRKLRHISNPGKTLVYLATEFINLRPQMSLFDNLSSLKKKEYDSYIPSTVSEDKLRLILVRFHNLQSLYDTYLSESDIESVDNRLRILRGHISFIYHMLKSATELTHYYERHIKSNQIPVKPCEFLEIIIDFYISCFVEYFKGGINLCYDVIESYGEVSTIVIPIPPYRGFHVRPSTLISKIVNYYGARVKMILNNTEYDPSTPLELFRVNEEINAIKRDGVNEYLLKNKLYKKDLEQVLSALKEHGILIQYREKFDKIPIKEDEAPLEYMKRAIAYLLAAGVIDIKMEIFVKYIGDTRVLNDLKTLSEANYGEDLYGNNIALPKELSYLKR